MENSTPTKKKQLPAYLVLAIIALVAAVVLAVTNQVTKGPIQEHQMAALRESFGAVMPADDYVELTVPAGYDVSSLYEARQGGETIGYCVTAVSKGYNGDVAVTLGVGTDGLVTGCAVGDTSFAETPGFGARAKEDAFQDQFKGIDAVNGGSFEALSGATVTSTAVLTATNAALRCVDEVALQKTPAADPLVTFGAKAEADAPAPAAPLTGNVLTGSAKGYDDGEVSVNLTLDDAGAITALTVDANSQTPGLGQRCMEAEFTDRFIGKTIPVEGVDALAGATVTSNAVIEAVNGAAPAAAEGMTASKKGFVSDVTVTLTTDGAGAIATLSVDASGETEGLGQRCAEEAFTSQFIGKSAPLTLGDGIDAVTGATITSTAVVDAVNELLSAPTSAPAEVIEPIAELDGATLGVKPDGAAVIVPADGFTGALDVNLTVEKGSVTEGALSTAAPATEAEAPAAAGKTASKKGFASDVAVTVTTDEAGAIATLTVDASGETAGLGQKCAEEAFTSQFIGKTAPFTLGDGVEAVSGATVTSTAVVDALNELLPAAEVEAPAIEWEALAADGKTASKKGFASDVAVTVTTDEAGAVATLTVDASGETAGLGQKCAEEAFTSQFIGKTAPFTLGDGIEAVSGATVTSTAVVDALNELLPAAEVEAPATEAEAPAADGKTASKKGFASDVAVTVTTDEAGAIVTLTVDASGETAGLGQKCAEEAFTSQFIGKTAPFTLGDGIEAVSGATVTSTAVVDALNELLPAAEVEAPATEAEAPAADGKTASKKGFASDVAVTVTTDEAGAIATLTVDASGETAGLGQKCAEEAFTSQFIGKTAPFTLGDGIEAVSGATVTSTAVVDALNELLPAAEVEAPATEAEAPAADDKTASKKGFASDVAVTVTTDEAGAIATLTVDASGETAGLGQKCAEEAFTSQFIGKTAPFTLGDGIEAVSGATVTSTAVVDALNELLPAAEVEAPATEAEATPAPAAETETPAAPANVTATGVAPGKMSDVVVKVTTDAEGKISAIVINATGETKHVGTRVMTNGKFAKQFTGLTAPVVLGEGVDALTGATVTSQAVVDAVNNALLLPAEEAPAAEPVEAEAAPAPAAETEAPAALANVTATGVAPGKMSDVVVKVTTDAEGKISAIVINATGETKNVGTRVMTNGKFAKQFTGLTAPVTLGEGVDALTGATVTSQAVVDAVNNALLPPAEEAPAAEPVEAEAAPAPIAEAEAPVALANVTATGVAPGKMSDVVVKVTTDAEGKISAIVINATGETKHVGTRVMTNGKFAKQFTGLTAPVALGEGVDALTGATVTSQAVVDAVNNALGQ